VQSYFLAALKPKHAKFIWHGYRNWKSCRLGDCTLMHGFYFNAHVAATCLAKYRSNVIFGHTHRLQYVADGHHYAVSLGHGSDENQTAHQPTPTGWEQAIGVLTVFPDNSTDVEIIRVRKGIGIYGGKKI